MISAADQKRVVASAQRWWERGVRSARFREICSGKERGHRVADYVEEQTLKCLTAEKYAVAFERDRRGKQLVRSMGDVWLRSGRPRICNPINVKASVAGKKGQPNMVSLTKLTRGLVSHLIDSYWLLLIRFEENGSGYTPHVLLVNILDYLDFMHFDAGPGQIMLKSASFYQHVAGGPRPRRLSAEEAMGRLVEMRRDGNRRLTAKRARDLRALETRAKAFDPTLAVDQGKLRISAAD